MVLVRFPNGKSFTGTQDDDCNPKTTGIEEWRKAVGNGVRLQSVSVCTGTNVMWDKEAQDWATMQEVLKSCPDIKMITVDVANAYQRTW